MDSLISAYKRALHFCKDMPDAPFSVIRQQQGPFVAATNYQWLIDAPRFSEIENIETAHSWALKLPVNKNMLICMDCETETKIGAWHSVFKPCKGKNNLRKIAREKIVTNELLEDISIMTMWAESLNRYIDAHTVANDELLKWALAAWKSRMFFNPIILNSVKP